MLSIKQCQAYLSANGKNYSDEEVKKIREFLYTLGEIEYDILDAFVDHGLNLIDTANIYSTWVPGNKGGESETIIGKWLKKSGKRNKVVLATKVGMEMAGAKGLKSAYIRECLEQSGTDVNLFDLYLRS